MRDKDSQLIFESYNERILVNEAAPLVMAGIAILGPIAAYISGKTGLTDAFTSWLKRASNGFIDIKEWEQTTPYQMISFLDPTGLSVWPTVSRMVKVYEENPTDENKFELWLSIFYAVPVLGKFKAFVGAFRGSQAAVKDIPLLYKLGIKLAEKILRPILESKIVKDAFIKIYTKTQYKIVQNAIINSLSIIGVRWATKSFFASVMTGLDGNPEEYDDYLPSVPKEGKYKPSKYKPSKPESEKATQTSKSSEQSNSPIFDDI